MKYASFSAVVILLLHSNFAAADVLTYDVFATLVDGGTLTGTFSLDQDAPDLDDSPSRGRFEMVEVDLVVSNTTVLPPSMGGTSTEGLFFQQNNSQFLVFTFIENLGTSGAFTDIAFGPFNGDPNSIDVFLSDRFQEGYLDGNGQVPFVTFQVVPEPNCSLLVLISASLIFARRRSLRLSR